MTITILTRDLCHTGPCQDTDENHDASIKACKFHKEEGFQITNGCMHRRASDTLKGLNLLDCLCRDRGWPCRAGDQRCVGMISSTSSFIHVKSPSLSFQVTSLMCPMVIPPKDLWSFTDTDHSSFLNTPSNAPYLLASKPATLPSSLK